MLRALYWFIAGTCIGFGVLAILSIGLVFLVAGVAMVLFGVFRLGMRELWAGPVGVGLLPLLILMGDLASPQPIQPASTAQTYTLLAGIFGAIALVGLLWGLIGALRRSRPGSVA